MIPPNTCTAGMPPAPGSGTATPAVPSLPGAQADAGQAEAPATASPAALPRLPWPMLALAQLPAGVLLCEADAEGRPDVVAYANRCAAIWLDDEGPAVYGRALSAVLAPWRRGDGLSWEEAWALGAAGRVELQRQPPACAQAHAAGAAAPASRLALQLQHLPGGGAGLWLASLENLGDAAAGPHQGALSAAARHIVYLQHHDGLTGLLLRDAFRQRLRARLADTDPAAGGGALLIFEIEGLAAYNQLHGLDAGDRLLVALARTLNAAVGGAGLIARLAPARLAAFVPLAAGADAEAWASALHGRLAAQAGARQPLHAGLVRWPQDVDQADGLLLGGELALEAARRRPGKSFARLMPGALAQARDHVQLRQALEDALALGQFELHYQPRVDGRDGRMLGVEALLRWRHPVWGLVAPARFIALAETSGLIVPMGAWVLEAACAQLAAWDAAGAPPLQMAINFSPLQLAQPGLAQQVADVLARTGLAPGRLEVEITESVLLDHGDEVQRVMHELAQLGTRLALDDFGTGYSSLAYLQRLPLHTLKIDRAFVQPLCSEPRQAAIAGGIVQIGRSLGLTLVAEGVESACQRDALLALGCCEMQGFLFARPQPAADLVTRLGLAAPPHGPVSGGGALSPPGPAR